MLININCCWDTKNGRGQFFQKVEKAQFVLNVLDKRCSPEIKDRSKCPWSFSKDLRQFLWAGAERREETEKQRPGEIGSTIIFCWTLWGLVIWQAPPPPTHTHIITHTHTRDPVSLHSSRVLLVLTYCSCWLCTYPVFVSSYKLRKIADTANKHTHT